MRVKGPEGRGNRVEGWEQNVIEGLIIVVRTGVEASISRQAVLDVNRANEAVRADGCRIYKGEQLRRLRFS